MPGGFTAVNWGRARVDDLKIAVKCVYNTSRGGKERAKRFHIVVELRPDRRKSRLGLYCKGTTL